KAQRIHLHVKRLTLAVPADRDALIESLRLAIEQRLQSPDAARGDWSRCITSAVTDALSPAAKGRAR
ncbi:MAG TPA: hypothetical protein VJ608_04365, partial [Albitalea sp.]|nr:hypothetical protein [Albitalea sp.]